MTHQDAPSERVGAFIKIYTHMKALRPDGVLEGLAAWAARLECRIVSLSVDCETCQT